jgi:hypothetical protein
VDALIAIVVIIAICVILILAATVIISVLTHNRMMREGALPEQEAQLLREQLLEAVGEASTEPRTAVDLRGFWKDTQLTSAQRYVLLRPLLGGKVLHAVFPTEQPEAFFSELMTNVFHRPARTVSLNTRDWTRLASGTTAGIVVSGVSGGIVQIGDHNKAKVTQPELSPDFIATLIEALRIDAATNEAADSERAESLADSLETDLKKDRWASIRDTVKTVATVVSSGTSAWAATAQLFD